MCKIRNHSFRLGTAHKIIYSVLSLSITFILLGCVDKADYSFNYDYVKELYDKTFPVNDIDPLQDWKTTSLITLNVEVYEDALETYKIKVYDECPYADDFNSSLLATGTVENGSSLKLQFDCPLITDTLWVVKVDNKNRRTAKIIGKSEDNINVIFGNNNRSRAYTENTSGCIITPKECPYTESEINNMLSKATEIESNKAFGVNYGTINGLGFYKLTKNGEAFRFVYNGSTTKNILIVNTEVKAYKGLFQSNGGNLTIIVGKGGKITDSDLYLTNGTNLCIMPGGSIVGAKNNITLTNASEGKLNYNGGSINANELNMFSSDGTLYNAGNINVAKYTASNSGSTLINMQNFETENLNTVNSNLENGCLFKVTNDCSFTNIVIGNGGAIECGTLNKSQWGEMKIKIGHNAMINCKGEMNAELKIDGPTNGDCLIKANSVISNIFINSFKYYAKNVTFEINEFLSGIITLSKICKNTSSISYFGESNIYIPAGECTGDGNNPNDSGGDNDNEKSLTYTYCYEDYYPTPGDYDFNDIVMDASYELTKSKNMVTKLKMNIQLTAVGATYQIGGALQLVNLNKDNIDNVKVTGGNLSVGNIFNDINDETANNVYAIIPLFNDAHYLISGQSSLRYMYNTAVGHEGYKDATPKAITVEVTFKNPVSNVTLDNIDLFIARLLQNGGYYEGQKDKTRIEVHLREFWENRTYKGVNFANNEAAAGNRTWAICVPDFKYPYETIPIYRIEGTSAGSSVECAYPKFQIWASDRTQAVDWYKYPNANSTYR